MDSNTIGLILTAVGCSAGATWVVCAALRSIGEKLTQHVAEDQQVHADVIELKTEAAKRRKGRR